MITSSIIGRVGNYRLKKMKGINVSWDNKPVDWQMMVLINSILTTTAVIADTFDAEERKILGPWLNKLVRKVAKSSWMNRQDKIQITLICIYGH